MCCLPRYCSSGPNSHPYCPKKASCSTVQSRGRWWSSEYHDLQYIFQQLTFSLPPLDGDLYLFYVRLHSFILCLLDVGPLDASCKEMCWRCWPGQRLQGCHQRWQRRRSVSLPHPSTCSGRAPDGLAPRLTCKRQTTLLLFSWAVVMTVCSFHHVWTSESKL